MLGARPSEMMRTHTRRQPCQAETSSHTMAVSGLQYAMVEMEGLTVQALADTSSRRQSTAKTSAQNLLVYQFR